ncbi:MAG: hypothetical protein HYU69_14075, partial [Bacteroidetes bacterium]|nr:hypothetical protein [Bacteroidota bacterium]
MGTKNYYKNSMGWFIITCFVFSLSVSHAQTTCATAENIATLPFDKQGVKTCGLPLHNYSVWNCLPASGFGGYGYLFKYTPSQTDYVDIITKITSGTALKGVAVFVNCPGSAGFKCISTTSSNNAAQDSVTILNTLLTAGTTYYILVSGGAVTVSFPYVPQCITFNLHVQNRPPAIGNPLECEKNIDFEYGNLNQWTGCTFGGCFSATGNPCAIGTCPNPGFIPSNGLSVNGTLGNCVSGTIMATNQVRHTITTGPGTDPNTDNVVTVVAPAPYGGSYSMRLGNQETAAQSECIMRSFVVTPKTTFFTYLYAVVLENPAHSLTDQPKFLISITDASGKPINCGGTYEVNATNAQDTASGFVLASNPACREGLNGPIYYKNWTAVGTALSSYMGQTINVKFCTRDCALGGHYGYAYIDIYCNQITGFVLCQGATSSVLTAPLGFTNYKWYSGPAATGPVLGTEQTYTVTTPVNGQLYTVSFAPLANPTCTSTYTDTIKMFTASAGNDTMLTCSTGKVVLKAWSNDPAATYSWSSSPAGFTSSLANPDVSPTVTTTYSVSITGSSGCTVVKTITVTVAGSVKPVVNNSTVCPNESATLTASGGTSYTWNTGQTTPSITVVPATTTIYTIVVSNGSCSDTITSTVTVKPPVIPMVNSSTVCPGESATLTASGGTSYTWSNGQTTPSITVTPVVTTSYKVTVINGGCSDSITATVTVNQSVIPIVNSITVCSGESATLTASGGANYTWSSGQTTAAITVTPSVTTSYTVTVSNGGCMGTTSGTVTVQPPVTPAINSGAICPGQNFTLTASGGTSYTWSSGQTTAAITVTPSVTTNYTVTVSNGGCSDSITTTVTVAPPVTPVANSTSTCPGQSATLTASGGTSYTWSTGQTSPSIIVTPVSTTSYTVTISDGGCTSTTTSTVIVNPPVIAAVSSSVVCIGQNATLTASGGTNYLWSTGQTTQSITISPSATTSYSVIVSTGSCSDTAYTIVTANPAPTANFTSKAVCFNNPTVMINNSMPGSGLTYSWNLGNGNTSTLQ